MLFGQGKKGRLSEQLHFIHCTNSDLQTSFCLQKRRQSCSFSSVSGRVLTSPSSHGCVYTPSILGDLYSVAKETHPLTVDVHRVSSIKGKLGKVTLRL